MSKLVLFFYLQLKDAIYPEPKLFPSDPYERAKTLMVIDGFQRVIALLFKVLKIKDNDAFNEITKVLDNYEKLLKDDYFGGKQAGIVDYMIWLVFLFEIHPFFVFNCLL
jgi:glutathione S-transferase